MQIILLLIGISLLVAVGFLIAFVRSVKSGQFDDLYSPGRRILFEEDPNENNKP